MTLQRCERGGISLLHSAEWHSAGIVHGFIGSDCDFSAAHYHRWQTAFLSAFESSALFLPLQTHSSFVVDLRGEEEYRKLCVPERQLGFARCDALVFPSGGFDGHAAFGVRTADCVPIIIKDRKNVALIHAGWRGLAAGIIGNTLNVMNPEGPVSALIGPAAGVESYEVGEEVISAIGPNAVWGWRQRNGMDKTHLDLSATAERILKILCGSIAVVLSGVCTVTDLRFHSFRREGAPVGSNLAFVRL